MKSVPLKWIKSVWFTVERVAKISPVQDPVHLGVKLKARLMTQSQILPHRMFSARSSHLTMLQSSFCKEQHNLRVKDLEHQNRQNTEAIIRLTSENLIILLDEFPDALWFTVNHGKNGFTNNVYLLLMRMMKILTGCAQDAYK